MAGPKRALTGSLDDVRGFEAALGPSVRVPEPVPIELPSQYPVGALGSILTAEAAAAFDDITRDKRVNLMERSTWRRSLRD